MIRPTAFLLVLVLPNFGGGVVDQQSDDVIAAGFRHAVSDS
ncbi:hypothetical protein [Schaalia sp. ZJ1691]|nr:hypothetical protein [Schaalia sp. ZJ1691]